MVKRVNLKADPVQAFSDLTRSMVAQSRAKNTPTPGVKDLGVSGDVVWTRPDSPEPVSVRAVDAAMVELDATMAETRTDLATLNDATLPELQAHLEQQIADIVVTGGGNTTTYSVNAPSADGTAEGDTWYRVVDGKAVGQWQWTSGAWTAVTLTDAVLAGVDVSKLTATGVVPSVVAQQMFADIFSANKIGANQINANSVAGAVGNFLELKAEQVTSGSFVGEKFSGGLFEGATFRTSDPKPGAVTFSETAFSGSPGIGIEPPDSSIYSSLPGIGPNTVDGKPSVSLFGGRLKTGSQGTVTTWAEGAQVHWGDYSSGSGPGAWVTLGRNRASIAYQPSKNTASTKSGISADADQCTIRRDDADGSYAQMLTSKQYAFMEAAVGNESVGQVIASPTRAQVSSWSPSGFASFRADDKEMFLWREKKSNGQRLTQDIFAFDDDGLTYKQAAWDTSGNQLYNRWTKFGDSGWIGFDLNSAVVTVREAVQYRVLNSVFYIRGVISPRAGNWTGDQIIGSVPTVGKPSVTQRRSPGIQSTVSAFLDIKTDGVIRVWVSAATPEWINLSGFSYAQG